MASNWILTTDAGSTTFADGRISNVVRERSSQGPDTVSLRYANTFDAAAPAFESKAVISKVDAIGKQSVWFTGWVTSLPRYASGSEESVSLKLSGPWYWLEQMIFENGWLSTQNGAKPLIVGYTSHLLLNLGAGGLITTGQQIRAVLQYVLDMFTADAQAAPFAIGDITPAIYAPIDEVRDLSCADVIRKQLRWHPDAVCWFDSSTTPPTFHCKSRTELVGVDLPLPTSKDSGRVSRWSLVPRFDLLRRSVAIRYEKKSTIDGQDILQIINDVYPVGKTGREPRSATATVDLQGIKASNVRASLTVEAVPADLKAQASLAWWKSRIPELNNPAIGAITINKVGRLRRNLDGTETDISQVGGLPNEVIEGQVAPWMTINGAALSAQHERVNIEVSYAVYDGDASQGGAVKMTDLAKPFTHYYDLVTTDGVTGDYSAVAGFESADPQPIGLAQALFTILQTLHYEGEIELTETEVGEAGAVGLGNTVNLTNGMAEFAAMRALVQSVREDIDKGITILSLGVPTHLGISDLTELLRVNRTRIRYTSSATQSTGGAGSSDLRLGKQTANSSRGASDQVYKLWVVKVGNNVITLDAEAGLIKMNDSAGHSVTMELSKCVGGNAARALAIQETNVCEKVNGVDVTKKILVLRSDSY